MKQCEHQFQAVVDVKKFTDLPGKHSLHINVFCKLCKMPFRFVGLPVGEGIDRPEVNAMGIEAKLPIQPGISVVDSIFNMVPPEKEKA